MVTLESKPLKTLTNIPTLQNYKLKEFLALNNKDMKEIIKPFREYLRFALAKELDREIRFCQTFINISCQINKFLKMYALEEHSPSTDPTKRLRKLLEEFPELSEEALGERYYNSNPSHYKVISVTSREGSLRSFYESKTVFQTASSHSVKDNLSEVSVKKFRNFNDGDKLNDVKKPKTITSSAVLKQLLTMYENNSNCLIPEDKRNTETKAMPNKTNTKIQQTYIIDKVSKSKKKIKKINKTSANPIDKTTKPLKEPTQNDRECKRAFEPKPNKPIIQKSRIPKPIKTVVHPRVRSNTHIKAVKSICNAVSTQCMGGNIIKSNTQQLQENRYEIVRQLMEDLNVLPDTVKKQNNDKTDPVLVFDRKNPINNIKMAPVIHGKINKYAPIRCKSVQCHTDLLEKDLPSLDLIKHVKSHDVDVNTMITMKSKKHLLTSIPNLENNNS